MELGINCVMWKGCVICIPLIFKSLQSSVGVPGVREGQSHWIDIDNLQIYEDHANTLLKLNFFDQVNTNNFLIHIMNLLLLGNNCHKITLLRSKVP